MAYQWCGGTQPGRRALALVSERFPAMEWSIRRAPTCPLISLVPEGQLLASGMVAAVSILSIPFDPVSGSRRRPTVDVITIVRA